MIEIRRADELGETHRHRLATVFVRGFAEDFAAFSRDPERLASAFAHMLVLERWRVALLDGEPAAVAFVTEGAQEALAPRWAPMRRALGLVRGTLTFLIVRSQFVGAADDARPGLVEIGFVTTDPALRGRGAAKQLLRRILDEETAPEVVLRDIKDTNEAALGLYRRLGFEEYERRPVRFAERSGFRDCVSVKLVRSR
ncbi:GNAT family N-acetyltransferase [Brachybacterium sp. AOP43-C2-M15]|uniref:GNAT family N-acetyltransferase n=1 Tax=Brachybacterium sp. AOP43-C2-M15 TaxID=3457661 RepID=UPI0040344E9A